ncbi:MAG: hypothetical protein MRY76_06785 [Pseudomonadales bacterium]|nr:hypothetical protein [Pseudomonadales bacterium]
MKTIKSRDCGNSPKNSFVQDLEIAIAESDFGFLAKSVSEELQWEICGIGTFNGSSSIPEALDALNLMQADQLSIEFALSHGKTAASQSLRTRGLSDSQYVSNFFKFSSAKAIQVSRIVTMAIQRSNNG